MMNTVAKRLIHKHDLIYLRKSQCTKVTVLRYLYGIIEPLCMSASKTD